MKIKLSDAVKPADVRKRLPGLTSDAVQSANERLGVRLGALAALVRILEIRVEELEGPEGTGSLEQDEEILSKAATAAAMASGGGVLSDEAAVRRLACTIYRCEGWDSGQTLHRGSHRAWEVRSLFLSCCTDASHLAELASY